MALQEVSPALASDLRRLFPDHGLAYVPHCGEGLAVLVRGQRPWPREIPLPGGRKRALLVNLAGDVTLANVHLSWTGDPDGKQRRGMAQLEAILAYQPDLVVGDFNAFPDWPERRLIEQAGYRSLGPAGPTCNVGRRLQPLDAIYARPEWLGAPTPLPVITETTPLPSPTLPSDHLPLEVMIRRSQFDCGWSAVP